MKLGRQMELMQRPKSELDPFRAIVGVLANRNESDLLISVVSTAGLPVDLQLTDEQAATNKTRIRAILPRIYAAYHRLGDEARLMAASVAIRNFGSAYPDTYNRAVDALRGIGWNVQEDRLVVASPDVREIFFPKDSPWDAHIVLRDIFARAAHSLTIVDPYADGTVFRMLSARPVDGLSIRVLGLKSTEALAAEGKTFERQFSGVRVEVRRAKDFHDRFVIVDDRDCIHVGASIKDAGKTAFMVSAVEDPANSAAILRALEESWTAAAPVT